MHGVRTRQKNGLCSTRAPFASIAASALSRDPMLGASTTTRTLPSARCLESRVQVPIGRARPRKRAGEAAI
jgi:hypothetical protein